ncbi:hypothetical protein BN946_scf184967.g12 [Trametes cinnabarina]|uniref:AB hydrolase-1 domain-containing protein n=1 Tax=Pycnoporus cinnabarinus TaxID=5643 RepID=A0A060SST0_PYCCI|nr:hypothetical protein BN946_scf184967.g12 [Trametes cinnabarina]
MVRPAYDVHWAKRSLNGGIDLYGKGYSEAPHVIYDSTFFAVQLALLLQYIRWDAAHIVGFSMGGGVAAVFAATLPHLVAGKVVLISSAGLIDHVRAPNPLRDLQASDLPGYKRSLQSCFVDGPIRDQEAAFDKLGNLRVGPAQQPLQVLVLHGTEDAIVPVEEGDKIKNRVPQAEVVKVDGAQHDVVLRDGHWQIVAKNLVRFLK